jgi:hypothetical protein
MKMLRVVFLFVAITAVSLLAGPMISVDSADFDAGVIREGQAKSLKHVFKIKNTGDSVLLIQQVKPG